MRTQSRALSARPDLCYPGRRVEIVVEGKKQGEGEVIEILHGIIGLAKVRLDDGSETRANLRWVWAI